MEISLLTIGAIVIFVVIRIFSNATASFDDPRPMSNQHLLSAIGGQADWLEKVKAAPYESQQSSSIIDLSKKRRNYIARLCLELLSRKQPAYVTGDEESAFPEAAKYAKDLESVGVSRENAAVRAVKEKLVVPSGFSYPSSWEI
ncbi:MAG: hypothetical protein ACYC0M_03295 [Burkholderiales bacterium]